MNCYKCQSKTELSIKKRSRQGVPIMICKPCRRDNYHKSKLNKPILSTEEPDMKIYWEFLERSKQSLLRILSKCNQQGWYLDERN